MPKTIGVSTFDVTIVNLAIGMINQKNRENLYPKDLKLYEELIEKCYNPVVSKVKSVFRCLKIDWYNNKSTSCNDQSQSRDLLRNLADFY